MESTTPIKQPLEFDEFFKVQTPSSLVKANLVVKYFPQYCRIILKGAPQNAIWYMDLFSGPGMYDDGNWSTPLLIGDICARDNDFKNTVRLIFNDIHYKDRLEANFLSQFTADTFRHNPVFRDFNMETDNRILDYLRRKPIPQQKNPNPTVLFYDPFGYKAVDTQTLITFLSHWGNEIFLFVNIKRITAALEADKFQDNVQRLFPTNFDALQKGKRLLPHVHQRTAFIIHQLIDEFKKAIGEDLFSTAFKFMEEDSIGTSHFIIHFTKHVRGYELAKQVFYEWDNIGATLDGDGTFTFDAKALYQQKQSLFGSNDDNLINLANDLANKFQGKTLNARQLFDQHHVNSKYCSTHYTQALRKLVDDGKLNTTFTDNINHRFSAYITEHCILQFA